MELFENMIGTVLDGRFRIDKNIGTGGMACVFLAYDNRRCEYVALKILRPELAENEANVQRFLNESRAESMLSHPNIVSVYDVSVEGKYKYIVMEYVEGETLREYMNENCPLPEDEVTDLSLQILSALSHAHEKGIVHQDIKPQNILRQKNGQIKIGDFGIARLPGINRQQTDEKAIGTVYYMSPEQSCNKPVDRRSDLYSLGVLMYEMITGKLPFDGDSTAKIIYQHCNEAPAPIRESKKGVSKGFEQIVLRALSKSPASRFSDDRQMADYLRRLQKSHDMVFEFIDDALTETVRVEMEDHDQLLIDITPQAGGDIAPKAENEISDAVFPNNPETPSAQNKKKKQKKEKKKKKKEKPETVVIVEEKPSRVSFISLIFGILVGLGLVGVVSFLYLYETFFLPTTTAESDVIVVSDFVGEPYSESFVRSLEKQGYEVEVEWKSSTDYLAGTVMAQSPASGERRIVIEGKQNCLLHLTVSKGENMLYLANYVGSEYRQADIEMRELGMTLQFEFEYNETMEEGRVLRTFPQAGSFITSETLITVYVSRGAQIEYTKMPDFRKLNAMQVHDLLEKSGLMLGDIVYEYSDEVPAGLVIGQNVTAGAVLPSGNATLILTVSMGSDPNKIIEPEPFAPPVQQGQDALL